MNDVILHGSNSVGKTLRMILYAKVFPNTIITVKDQGAADKLVALGMNPAQIRLSSELTTSGRAFDVTIGA